MKQYKDPVRLYHSHSHTRPFAVWERKDAIKNAKYLLLRSSGLEWERNLEILATLFEGATDVVVGY